MSIIKLIRPNKTILDVGCSDGYLATLLPNNYVYGVDYNPSAIEQAKNKCRGATVVDLNNLKQGDNLLFNYQFDYIVMADILEHLVNPDMFLKYVYTILKDDGEIFVSLPNIALWKVRLSILFGKFKYTDYGVLDQTHLHFYTFKTATELLKNNGFAITKCFGSANVLGPLVRYLPMFKNLFSINIILMCKKSS